MLATFAVNTDCEGFGSQLEKNPLVHSCVPTTFHVFLFCVMDTVGPSGVKAAGFSEALTSQSVCILYSCEHTSVSPLPISLTQALVSFHGGTLKTGKPPSSHSRPIALPSQRSDHTAEKVMGHPTSVRSGINPCVQLTTVCFKSQPDLGQEQCKACLHLACLRIPSVTSKFVDKYQQGRRKAVLFWPNPRSHQILVPVRIDSHRHFAWLLPSTC